jgi:hypothetical protein
MQKFHPLVEAEISSTENVQQNFESAAKPDERVYPNRIGHVNHFCGHFSDRLFRTAANNVRVREHT